jgi:hypothetical protein
MKNQKAVVFTIFISLFILLGVLQTNFSTSFGGTIYPRYSAGLWLQNFLKEAWGLSVSVFRMTPLGGAVLFLALFPIAIYLSGYSPKKIVYMDRDVPVYRDKIIEKPIIKYVDRVVEVPVYYLDKQEEANDVITVIPRNISLLE